MAVRFQAATDAYTSAVVPSGAFTATCWVRLVSDLNNYSPIWGIFNGTSVYRYLSTAVDGTTLTFYGGSGTATGPNMVVGTWYRAAVVVNGNDVTLYHGTETGSLTTVSAPGIATTAAVNEFRIGGSTFAGEALDARVAAEKLWEAILTPAEIVAELAQYEPKRTANLHRDHRFITAETTDYSGNGNHLTAGSTATTTVDGPPIPNIATPVRFFLQNVAGAFTPTIRGAWDNVTQTGVRAMGTAKSGTFVAVTQAAGSTALPWDVLQQRFMGPPMLSGGPFSGTVEWILGVSEGAAQLDAYFKVHLYVCVGTTDVVRGTLGTFQFGPSTAGGNIVGTEWGTAYAGRGEGLRPLTSVTCSAGDRIVAEVGYRADGAGATSQQGSLRHGGTGADLTQGGTVLGDVGWFEFSGADALFKAAPVSPPGAFFPFFP